MKTKRTPPVGMKFPSRGAFAEEFKVRISESGGDG
jgi:hypothetical protein